MTIKDLNKYGNDTSSSDYQKALKKTIFYFMFYNKYSTIAVVPLATGAGKSTALINTTAYMCKDDELKPYCGTIILKQLIEDCNKTASDINKKYQQLNKTKDEIAISYHSKNNINPKDMYKYPIVITTHAMYKSMINSVRIGELLYWTDGKIDKKTVEYNTFFRKRVIIDEEIKTLEFFNVTMKTISILENAIMNLGNVALLKEYNNFILDIKKLFVKSYSIEGNTILFTKFDEIQMPENLDSGIYKSNDYKARESLLSIMNMLQHGAYIHKEDDIDRKSFITYKYININCPEFRHVLLDATSGINDTYKLNSNYEVVDMPEVKTYKNVTIHMFDGLTGSRKSMKDAFEDGLLESVVDNIKNNLLKDKKKEKALIVLNSMELTVKIKEAFEDYDNKDNIDFCYYGNGNVGSNKWSNYDKMFVLGIPLIAQENYCISYYCHAGEEDFNKYNNNMKPSKGAKVFINDDIEKLRVSTIVSELIQTFNRIKMRKLIKGDTVETHLYFLNKDKSIDSKIMEGMSGVNILYDWNLAYTSKKNNKTIQKETSNEQKLINLFIKIIDNKEYRQKLIEDKKYIEGKGIKKITLRTILEIKETAFQNAMNKPLTKQFFQDYNIDMTNTKSQYILV